ncbi:hypothetical protein FEM03_22085 [Phragmitibacter flavus]|uniref:Uncharacterized protein n=1 Tax=Phragmitibacter flavus TaxID=2576071 RepID=A0A5R8KAP2_9BACT|nr:hypothetical protein [Phragmitibacter flavus]TLD68609.1 hypothetical protein FEM03_22085 [Phragmitibacter flavus]
MKYFAIFITIALFSVMGYLIYEQRNEATALKNEFELLRRQQNPAAVNERDLEIAKLESQILAQQQSEQSPSSLPPLNPPPTTATAGNLPPLSPPPSMQSPQQQLGGPIVPPGGVPAPIAPPPLTARQRQILAAPPIGKVTEYQQEYGFVVISANAAMKVETSMTFAIRREQNIIGRIKVTSVDEGSTIADILPNTVPPGITVVVGDDIIQDLP